MLYRYGLILLTLFSCFALGCGSKNPGTFPVSIKITHKGAPLEGAIVSIVSTDGNGRSASGVTAGNGEAELHTTDGWKGAFPGQYAVAVTKWENVTVPDPSPESPDSTRTEQIDLLPAKFGDHSQSGFTIAVDKKNATQTFDIPE